MTKLKKWNVKSKEYEDYEVPDNWKVATYSNLMKERVNCCQCGKEITFGESYTSLEVHTEIGFGHAVCEQCYREEHKRKYGKLI